MGERFLHLESLDERSRPNAWNIRAHAHANLNHVFHIISGSGRMSIEGAAIDFQAPCAVLVPAGAVHGFAFKAETTGQVLTLSEAYLRELVVRDAELATLFSRGCGIPLGEIPLGARLAGLAQELVWEAPGHAAAVEAQLLGILVELLRSMRSLGGANRAAQGPHAQLVARFREMIERRYRTGAPIEDYSKDLGVTTSRLRDACLKVAGAAPTRLIQDRILLEARRALLYTNMTVAEVAFHLGFNDPAYFTRFFSKAVGQAPRAFRETKGG